MMMLIVAFPFVLLAFLLLASIIRTAVRRPLASLIACTIPAVIAFTAWNALEHQHRLAHIPDALDVQDVLYANEETWGLGPGGNEAGIVVYVLPDDVARAIEERGIDFLEHLPQNRSARLNHRQGVYEEWRTTPIVPDDHWRPVPNSGRSPIYDYICAYGFCIDIDERVLAETEAILMTPRSYYAYGRTGIIVICPARRRAVFMYNG